MTLFIRLLQAEDKSAELLSAVRNGGKNCFAVEPSDFQHIPSSPFAYWITSGIRSVFQNMRPYDNEDIGRTARCGLGTLDDFRFLRLCWETKFSRKGWASYYHGGVFSPFYDEFPLVVRWQDDGFEVKSYVTLKVGSASRKVQGEDHYFHEGFVFSRRTKALAPKFMPRGGIFSTGGQAGFAPPEELPASIALLSSTVCSFLISVCQGRTGDAAQFEVGLIKRLPWPEKLTVQDRERLSQLAYRVWSLKRTLSMSVETSHAFALPAPILQRITNRNVAAIERELAKIKVDIDNIAFRLYGLDGSDRAAIDAAGSVVSLESNNEAEGEHNIPAGGDDDEKSETPASDAEALLSWAVGVAFGRFDIRLATGQRAIPPEPAPFDPLPTKSSGMLPDGDDAFMPCSGVLVDDAGHKDDVGARVAAVYDHISEPTPEPDTLRRTLARDFFPTHVKMYSKARRKAPIYWQLATPSMSYTVWLYVHAFTNDTFFRVQNDYVAPKLAHEQRQLESIRAEAGPNPSGAQRNMIAAKEAFVEELRVLLDEVTRVASLWNPNLDDGVIINFAPLWRLVPHNKPWQKELKGKWDELVGGKYDWAHLAMRLWPERVIPKCAEDHSLAIAHGLEEVFWFEDAEGKWKPYEKAQKPIADLVRERTSTAVKAALKSLLDASEPTSGTKRSRKPKAA